MDGAGTRTHAPGRRMASTKTAPTARARGSAAPPDRDDALAVSPARWLGVALVLGALIVAMTMAATSTARPGPQPLEPAALTVTATATPGPVVAGEGVPTELPNLIIKADTNDDGSGGLVTRDREAGIVVKVPDTAIRARDLTLLVMRDGEIVEEIERPAGTEQPQPIELREGPNVLATRLVGPGGEGPVFELPIVLDTKAPSLKVLAPKDNQRIDEEQVTVRGTSDPGATVVVVNRTTREDGTQTVGPTGRFEEIVFLEPGENEIRVKVTDLAGNSNDIDRTVNRSGADVEGRISVDPQRLSVRRLPAFVRITAHLRDDGKPVVGAQVTFTLSVPGQPTKASHTIESGPDGTALWRTEVVPEGIETGEAQVTMQAKLPVGGRVDAVSKRSALTVQ
jgi:Glucodextranase, domain B